MTDLDDLNIISKYLFSMRFSAHSHRVGKNEASFTFCFNTNHLEHIDSASESIYFRSCVVLHLGLLRTIQENCSLVRLHCGKKALLPALFLRVSFKT